MKKLTKIVNINPKKIKKKCWDSTTRTSFGPLKLLIKTLKIEIFVLFSVGFKLKYY